MSVPIVTPTHTLSTKVTTHAGQEETCPVHVDAPVTFIIVSMCSFSTHGSRQITVICGCEGVKETTARHLCLRTAIKSTCRSLLGTTPFSSHKTMHHSTTEIPSKHKIQPSHTYNCACWSHRIICKGAINQPSYDYTQTPDLPLLRTFSFFLSF